MCGIVGMVGRPDGVNFTAMLNALSHRGPDGQGEYSAPCDSGTAWLAHRRLAIVDLTGSGQQPMQTSDRTLVLVFNGMIYNYREIRRELADRGHVFRTATDSEVLLAAWGQWGEAAIERLRGMFAFAIYEPRTEQLWLVRDRLGEKPLYFSHVGGRLLFGSEVRAVLASGVIPRALHGPSLDMYLAWGSVSEPNTLVRDIERVGAGEVVRCCRGTITRRVYWSLFDIAQREVVPPRAIVVERVAELIDDAAVQCMHADVAVGVLLSGGVDSAGLIARLHRRGYSGVPTFSVIFDGPDASLSEGRWSDAVAQRFRTEHTRVRVGSEDARELLPEALAGMDTPSKDGVNHYLVFQAAARAGMKVAVTGQGADEFFLGYGGHRLFTISRWIARLTAPEPLVRRLSRLAVALAPANGRVAKALNLLEHGDAERLAYLSRHLVFTFQEIRALHGMTSSPAAHMTGAPVSTSSLRRLYTMEATNLLRDQLLRDGDQMSMTRSLELRAPFLDHRLVEELATLPDSLLVARGRQKPLLIDAIDDVLVRRIARRPKVGFEIPMRRWIIDGVVGQLLDPDILGLDPGALREVNAAAFRGTRHARYWTLVVLQDWMLRNSISAGHAAPHS